MTQSLPLRALITTQSKSRSVGLVELLRGTNTVDNHETMKGESDLNVLLKNMQPRADKRVFVFCSVDAATLNCLPFTPLGLFQEKEGTTLILEKQQADGYSLAYTSVWTLITLTIHSELTAVGFLAAVTAALASEGISVNAVSAYYHDHLFVSAADRDRAMQVLAKLSSGS